MRHKTTKLVDEIQILLLKTFLSGDYAPGDAIKSERQISEEYNISRDTVRLCLKNLVSKGLLICKKGSGYYLPLKNQNIPKTILKGLLLLSQEDSVDLNEIDIYKGLRELCTKEGYVLDFLKIPQMVDIQAQIPKLKENFCGIVSYYRNVQNILKIYESGLPIVQMYQPIEGLPIDTVMQDDFFGMQLAYNHLVECGHRNIVYLDKSQSLLNEGFTAINHLRRKAGYQLAAEQNRTFDPNLIIQILPDDEFLLPTDDTFLKVVRSGASALIFPNNVNHRRIYKSLEMAAKNTTPHKNTLNAIKKGNFGVITWGAPTELYNNKTPTYVNWDKQQMGKDCLRRLLEKIREPQLPPIIIHIPTQLIKGNTSGKGPYFRSN